MHTIDTTTQINLIKLRRVYTMLRDISSSRIMQDIIDILLHERATMNVTEMERALYQRGYLRITHSVASSHMSDLRRYGILVRVHVDDSKGQHHYFTLNHTRLRQIQGAMDRFFRPDTSTPHSQTSVPKSGGTGII